MFCREAKEVPNLVQIFHELNKKHFSSILPLPILKWNYRLSSTAGTFSPGLEKARSSSKGSIIEVAGYLQRIPEGEKHIRDTLLHEMIHYWLWYRKKPFGHTPEFYKKMRETGAKRYNPVPKEPSKIYIYECPHCHIEIKAHRKLTNMACADCADKYNQGYFHSSFQLRMKKSILAKTDLSQESKPIEEEEEKVLPQEEALKRIFHIRESIKKSLLQDACKKNQIKESVE